MEGSSVTLEHRQHCLGRGKKKREAETPGRRGKKRLGVRMNSWGGGHSTDSDHHQIPVPPILPHPCGKTPTVRSAGQKRDSRAAHLRESAPRLAVRHSVRHRVEKERASDAAQREDVDCVDGGGVVSTVRALLNTFTVPGHPHAHTHGHTHTSVHHYCDRMPPHATSKASPIILNSRIWFD